MTPESIHTICGTVEWVAALMVTGWLLTAFLKLLGSLSKDKDDNEEV